MSTLAAFTLLTAAEKSWLLGSTESVDRRVDAGGLEQLDDAFPQPLAVLGVVVDQRHLLGLEDLDDVVGHALRLHVVVGDDPVERSCCPGTTVGRAALVAEALIITSPACSRSGRTAFVSPENAGPTMPRIEPSGMYLVLLARGLGRVALGVELLQL